MTDRYSYVKDFSELSAAHHKGVYQFALLQAANKSCGLRICVNNKSNCEQIMSRIFDEPTVNKLRTNKLFLQSGVNISLESAVTLKKEYFTSKKWVYLLLFPSPELLSVVEKVGSSEITIVFSETDNSNHLVEWAKNNEVKLLSPE